MNPVFFNSNIGRVFLNDVNDSPKQCKLIGCGFIVPFYDFADVVENLAFIGCLTGSSNITIKLKINGFYGFP